MTRKVRKTQAALKREEEQFSIGKTKEDVKALKNLLSEHETLKDVRKNNLLEVQKYTQIMMEKAQAEKECQTDAYLLRELLEENRGDASDSSRLQTR